MYQMKKGGSSKSSKQQAAIAMSMKAAGKKPKMAKGGSTSFGMLSVKAGVDNNPKPTAADRIAGAKMKKGGSVGKPKMKMGGSCGTPKSLKKK
jgi:hypothetical protein